MLLRPSISQEYYVTEFTFCRHVGTGHTLDITMHHIAIQDMLILCVNDVILLITKILFSVVP